MGDINGLLSSLKKYLGWNKCRVSCFTNMLLSLFSVRTVNLHEIALAYKPIGLDRKVLNKGLSLSKLIFDNMEPILELLDQRS